MKNIFLFVIVATVAMTVLSACDGNDSPVIAIAAAATLEGTWKRPVNGSPDEFEGMTFSADGHFGYINIYSMSGAGWEQSGRQLKLSSLTERYPQPEASMLQLEKLTDNELVLAGEGYLSGSYIRDDNFSGIVTGSLLLGDNASLPEDAVLMVRLNDVSRADAASVLIGARVIPVAGKSSPLDWRVYYPAGKIEQRFSYSVSATIAYANHIQFRTTTSYGVITHGLPNTLEIEAEKMPPKASPSGKPMQGMYNYMADAGLFMSCADGKTYPVAMASDNANLERAYLKLKSGDNTKVWIEVIGRLVEQTGMEGNIIQTALLVEKVMSLDKQKTCQPGLKGKWQLNSITGLSIPDDINPPEVAYIEFMADGKVAGKTGCNRLMSSYIRDGNQLKFGISAGTRMMCPPDFMQIESGMQKVMVETTAFTLDGDALRLKNKEGATLALFNRAEE